MPALLKSPTIALVKTINGNLPPLKETAALATPIRKTLNNKNLNNACSC